MHDPNVYGWIDNDASSVRCSDTETLCGAMRVHNVATGSVRGNKFVPLELERNE